MTAVTFRNAWCDPELVRLSEYRSWWDETKGPVERGPLADGENPWLTAEHPERGPSEQKPVRTHLPPKLDPYAEQRCVCSHILYSDEYPGCFCRFCKCTEHGLGLAA